MAKALKYTKEVLAPVVAQSRSVRQIIFHFGLRQTGGSYSNFWRLIRCYELDTSHFTGQGSNYGEQHVGGPRRLAPSELLILRAPGAAKIKVDKLRRALHEIGRPYACETCGNAGDWLGKPINLEVDHVNGNRFDDRQENLRFLCPNCHSQTETFGSRNARLSQSAEEIGREPIQSGFKSRGGHQSQLFERIQSKAPIT